MPTWAENTSTTDSKSNAQELKSMLNFSGKQNREASSSLRFTGMTADASGMIIDTSQGKKETSEILESTQTEHNRSEAVDRAKIALLKR